MWTIFIFIAVLLLFAIFLALAFVINILSSLVGGISNLWNLITGKRVGKSNAYSSSNNSSSSNFSGNSSSDTGQHNSHSHKKGEKVFTADDGEYVSFEEVKD